jgi:hypothetical protein
MKCERKMIHGISKIQPQRCRSSDKTFPCVVTRRGGSLNGIIDRDRSTIPRDRTRRERRTTGGGRRARGHRVGDMKDPIVSWH